MEEEKDMQEILEDIAEEFDEFYRHAQEFIDKLKKKGGDNGTDCD